MELVGYELMRLDERARTAELLRPGMQLDLGGIAKGYAGDEAIAVLAKRGITRALVAGSGDIVVSGPPPDQAGWKIGIGPLGGDEAKRLVMLRDAAVSTSGDAEQFVEIDGKRYSHIIDPKTGIGLSERSSATVIARRGIAADSLATAASVLGPRRAIELIDATDGTAAYIVRAGDRGVEEFKSSNFPTLARP
jgi:thiamine biosynthesis lipoprotein